MNTVPIDALDGAQEIIERLRIELAQVRGARRGNIVGMRMAISEARGHLSAGNNQAAADVLTKIEQRLYAMVEIDRQCP